MRSSVYVTVERPTVGPSACLCHRSTGGRFAAERWARRRYRSIAAGAGAASQLQAPALSSKCIDSRGTRLNTDLFHWTLFYCSLQGSLTYKLKYNRHLCARCYQVIRLVFVFVSYTVLCAFSALTLLVGRQEEHPAYKN